MGEDDNWGPEEASGCALRDHFEEGTGFSYHSLFLFIGRTAMDVGHSVELGVEGVML